MRTALLTVSAALILPCSALIVHSSPSVIVSANSPAGASGVVRHAHSAMMEDDEKPLQILQSVRDVAIAASISYVAWEVAFWTFAIPASIFDFQDMHGALPEVFSSG